MASFKVSEIIKCTGGTLLQGSPQARVRGVSTSSFGVKKGELFIAIIGKKHDAHDFIPEAIKKKAAGVIVSRECAVRPSSIAVIKVADTTKALGDIARMHRQRFSIPVIAVTGSAGKTTTKEMIALVLENKYNVLKNTGTENNQFGVPLTILRLSPSHDIAVLEIGTNCPGDIKGLASIAQPTVAVMTNIGESHLELLKTTRDVFQEKLALLKALDKGGVAIVNSDDPFLKKVPGLIKQKVHTFGIQKKANFQATEIKVLGQKIEFKVPGAGRVAIRGAAIASVYNALSAICCGRLFKIGYNDIKKSLGRFSFSSGRQALVKAGGITVIDDTYNANPVSFRSALQAVKFYKTNGRRVLVCGDMLELGEHSKRLHSEIGESAADAGFNLILSFGKFSRLIGIAASRRDPGITISHGATLEEIQGSLKEYLRYGDTVLVKGSRGMRMERFVEWICSMARKF